MKTPQILYKKRFSVNQDLASKFQNDLSTRNEAILDGGNRKSNSINRDQLESKIREESSHFNERLQRSYAKLNEFEREWSSSKLQH